MNELIAAIYEAETYGQSKVPANIYDTNNVSVADIVAPTESSDVITPTDYQMLDAGRKSVQESQRAIEGKATVGSPIRSPKSVGGSSKRPEDVGETDSWWDNPNASTAFQVQHYLNGAAQGMKAIASIGNGYVAQGQYNMKANSLDYLARQNERNAQNMIKNIREINRAAQNDINVISEMNVKRKSEQRVAQGASGFAVGKGSYKVLSENTDWKTNYNASMIALKAGLQGAEVLRAAGGLEAQAIINRADADIARKNAKIAKTNGWISGLAGLANAGASFYIGRYGVE